VPSLSVIFPRKGRRQCHEVPCCLVSTLSDRKHPQILDGRLFISFSPKACHKKASRYALTIPRYQQLPLTVFGAYGLKQEGNPSILPYAHVYARDDCGKKWIDPWHTEAKRRNNERDAHAHDYTVQHSFRLKTIINCPCCKKTATKQGPMPKPIQTCKMVSQLQTPRS
jgi:hypothetical protein